MEDRPGYYHTKLEEAQTEIERLRDEAKSYLSDYYEQRAEVHRLRSALEDGERELENILVSLYKVAPDQIQNPTLKRMREALINSKCGG